jgi:beta-lactamase regulating signal transducer with metallopeptidase domain
MFPALRWLADDLGVFAHPVALTLLRVTLLLAVAWLLHLAWRRRNPHLRVLLWRATAVATFVVVVLSLLPYRLSLPLLSAASSDARTPVAGDAAPSKSSLSAASTSAVEPASVTLLPANAATVDDKIPAPTDAAAATLEDALPSQSAQKVAPPHTASHTWLSVACAAYAFGVVAMALTYGLGALRLAALQKSSHAVPEHVQELARTIAAALHYHSHVDVRHSSVIEAPLTFGLRQPRIVIPSRQCEPLECDELRASLAHELAHCAGNDLRWNHLLALVRAALWFHPLVWRIQLAHADACDEICDAKAAGQLGDSSLYGRLLARIALRIAQQRIAPALSMARRSQVCGRIDALDRNQSASRLSRRQFAAFACVAMLTAILFGAATLRRSEAQTPTTAPTAVPSTSPPSDTVAEPAAETAPAGEPVTEPGAKVQVYVYADMQSEPRLVYETTADSKGRFDLGELPEVGEEGMLAIAAFKPAFSSTIGFFYQGRMRDFDYKLKPATATLTGVVTDAAGMPVAGAVVSAQPFNCPIPDIKSATTDADGRYTISDLVPWDVESTRTFDAKTGTGTMQVSAYLWVTHPSFPRTKGAYTRIPQTVDVKLLPPAIVSGSVVDLVSGRALPDVQVCAQGVVESGWYTTTTDADGNYELRMTNDHYNIWAEAPERMPLAIKAIQAVQGERLTGADIRMSRGGYVVGQVIDPATNAPVDGTRDELRVAHYGPARPKTGAAVSSALVGADGTYRLHVAPGRNYVYLMNGSGAHAYIEVGDDQTVEHDFNLGDAPVPARGEEDPDERLARKLRERSNRPPERASIHTPRPPEPATLRGNSDVGRLLTELEEMNAGSELFKDVWANQLRKIVALGPDAVPELVEELDRTSDKMMLRCLPFILRAIGDKRAVPSLIRAIPKTLLPGGSDMGLRIEGTDETLLEFVQKHDLGRDRGGNEYGVGRPVREVFGTLELLTGQKFDEEQLYYTSLNDDDFSSQKQAKKRLFHNTAERWASWWREHGGELTDDAKYHGVTLPPLANAVAVDWLSPDTPLKSSNSSGGSNWILQSVRNPKSRVVFYDFDTGRTSSLPELWRGTELTPNKLVEIHEWAAQNGYDLMGDEIPGDGDQPVFVLRPIGLRTWELPKDRWKKDYDRTSMGALQKAGRENTTDVLLHVDEASGKAEPLETATFFYVTREGTPGLLYVGIQVQDDNLQPGGRSEGDNELNPVAFYKGRRLGFSGLVAAD